MKTAFLLLAFSSVASTVYATNEKTQTSPLSKVLDLVTELTNKIVQAGEAEAKAYQEYSNWCDDTAKNAGFEIKTAEAKKEKLEAMIDEFTSTITVSTSKIGELVAAVAADDSQLKDATAVRDQEAAQFAASDAELVDCIDTLERAIAIISREMANNPAALTQVDTSSTERLVHTLGAVIDAAGFAGIDKQKLVAFVQSQNSDSDDQEPGAPEAAVYKSHSSGIVDVLQDLKDKAEASLSDLRREETNSRHNFEMLKQSLENQMAADGKDMEDEKTTKAEAAEGNAAAAGDLQGTVKLLKNTKGNLATASATCMQVATDHEATVKARNEELKAIATAKRILEETTRGAASETYSMLQVARSQSRAEHAGFEVVRLVKQLARKHHSGVLAQLVSQMTSAIRFGASGGDPFAKVKGLIENMVAKLEAEANAEATEKAYCDEEMAKTEAKRDEVTGDVSRVSAKIDQATSKSAALSVDIKELEAGLAALMRSQAEMDKIRQEEHAAFVQAQAYLIAGLNGVRQALTVLRDYYATDDAALVQQPAMPEVHAKATGAGNSIIGILEVVESDFATGLAKEEAQEDDAKTLYDSTTQENKVTKAMKDQDLKYKTAEVNRLGKAVADLSSDEESLSSELAAVNEYYAKLKDRCIAKPETYKERKARREAEISGLKEALQVLEDETAFVQRSNRRPHMRGALEAR